MSQENQSFDWSEEDVAQAASPFYGQLQDQFLETLHSRGYPVKTAAELQTQLSNAVRLHEKVASGELPHPNADNSDSAFAGVQDKLAALLDTQPNAASPQDQFVQHMQQKAAAMAADPLCMYYAHALDTMSDGESE